MAEDKIIRCILSFVGSIFALAMLIVGVYNTSLINSCTVEKAESIIQMEQIKITTDSLNAVADSIAEDAGLIRE